MKPADLKPSRMARAVVSLSSLEVGWRKVEKSIRGMWRESCETAVVIEEDMMGKCVLFRGSLDL